MIPRDGIGSPRVLCDKTVGKALFACNVTAMMDKERPKYRKLERVVPSERKWPERELDSPPVWCSVDLRDGNQALPIPMSPGKKRKYFETLVDIGFKEIEVGFPSASQDDFDFTQLLIREGLIPDGVRVSVLTQAREHLIQRTVEALRGVDGAILHCYVATSDLHGRIVFDRGRDEVLKMAVAGTRMSREALEESGLKGKVGYEFSPEEFTDTDIGFAVEVCLAVKEAWGPSAKEDFILNLPATVERRPPNQYADMVECFIERYGSLSETTISVHSHNDQGCAVAATELSLLAGAERVEGTLFGHGERTGNVDLMTFALNLMSRGVDSGLDFSKLPEIARMVEEASLIPIHPRHPYAGDLVLTAFSGSHQDAIRKGIERLERARELFDCGWKVPYLHIDPADVGRQYERLIRINSQSGKGGATYILEKEFGFTPPRRMHPEIGALAQRLADESGDEISSEELLAAFKKEFFHPNSKHVLKRFARLAVDDPDMVSMEIVLSTGDEEETLSGEGNGPISAMVHALRESDNVIDFILDDFSEQTLGHTADAKAVAFVSVKRASDDKIFYGAGIHANIDKAAAGAVMAALNRASLT